MPLPGKAYWSDIFGRSRSPSSDLLLADTSVARWPGSGQPHVAGATAPRQALAIDAR
jgi:hypothetical protein